MKKITLILLGLALLCGCKKSNESTNSCKTPSFTLTADNSGNLTVHLNDGTYGFLTAEYGTNGFTRGTGTKIQLTSYGGNISSLNNGAYDVYLQGNCGGNSNSDWAGPVSALVTGGQSVGTCQAPTSLNAQVSPSYVDMSWYYISPGGGSSLFEVQYDTTGFVLGHGKSQQTNNTSYSGGTFLANTTYDFVVRVKCSDGTWSAWSPRTSFYCTGNINQCQPPVSITASYQGSNVMNFSWDYNGEGNWEYGLTTFASPPTSSLSTSTTPAAAYGSITPGITYYFYVRAICQSGSRSAWQYKAFSI